MISTTVSQAEADRLCAGGFDPGGAELLTQYETLLKDASVRWAAEYKKIRMLGKGGQGVVYLSERQGTDLFRLPVALKIAFVTAGAIAGVLASPIPPGGFVLGTM